jgi:hypothetical protein
MINEVAFNHRVPVRISENRIAKDISGVQGWRSSKTDLYGIEIFRHSAIFRDVVVLAPEAQLGIGHLAVKKIAAMALIDHDEVILIDGRCFRIVSSEQHPLYQPLNGANMHLGFTVWRDVFQLRCR